MVTVSGFGLIVNVIASVPFPVGIVLTELADDSDPFNLPRLQIDDSDQGLKGDLIT